MNKLRGVTAIASACLIYAFSAAVVGAQEQHPVTLVDPFIGTGGTGADGLIDDFPGASAPFGMVQWSPDTTTLPPSGGYYYHDTSILGFSLTHLAGAGCLIYGDIRVFPISGTPNEPLKVRGQFSHDSEAASPGYYAVTFTDGIRTQLAATARTGIADFSFPKRTREATLVVNVASDQAGVVESQIRTLGSREIAGSATSGGFCGMPNTFTIYFDMRFDRPFASHHDWNGGTVLSFDVQPDASVRARAAVSYVSEDGARRNLQAEHENWNVREVAADTAASWDRLLSEVRISGGTSAQQRIFYTALYHALLSPTIFSDADRSYRGFDNAVHRVASGHVQYANFSGWDIYRTQLPLIALLAPAQTSDMMQSLVETAREGGWLPKWPAANGYTGVMGGDSAAPIIAGANAFGARAFDRVAALRALLKNAEQTNAPPGQGWYMPRPGLDEYLQRGYVVNTHTTSVSPVPNGASETLEYAIDDFSIAQFARSLRRTGVYQRYLRRAENWSNLYDGSTALIAPRDRDGAFMHTPLTADGQSGFQEGNAAQYTWMVPQALGSLVRALGGSAAAISRLDLFFTQLDAGPDKPYAWFGNEPTLASPWTYLYAQAPYKAQAVLHAAMTSLYAATPDGIPGNDDLGTMSAWWVWNAMGLYPLNPSVPVLLLGTPLFTHVTIASPTGRTLDIDAPQASDANIYVQSLRVNGNLENRAWVTLPDRGTVRLTYELGSSPATRFATSAAALPPDYTIGMPHFPPSTSAVLSSPKQTLFSAPGDSIAAAFIATNASPRTGERITWNVEGPQGIRAVPARGVLNLEPGSAATLRTQLTALPQLLPGLYNVLLRAKARNGAPLAHATAVVRVAAQSEVLPLAYVANFSDDTVQAFDARTHAYGTPIHVGRRPGDLAISLDGTRVYTANQGSNDVSIVDTSSEKLLATVKAGRTPAGIGLTPNGQTLWISNYDDGTIQSIDTATLRAGRPIAVGRQPEQLAIAPDGIRMYIADYADNDIAVVDLAGRSVIAHVAVGRHPLGVAVSPDSRRIYVTNAASNDLSVIDRDSLSEIARVPVGKNPQGLGISPDGARVFVANSGSNDVTPIDTGTNRVGRSIRVGNGPFDVLFTPDGRQALVADSGDNEISTIDIAAGRVRAAIDAGNFPIAFAHPYYASGLP